MDQLTRRVTEVNEVGRRRQVVATFTPETVFDEQKNACNFYIWSSTKYRPEDYASINPEKEVHFGRAWLFLLAYLSHNLTRADFGLDGCIKEERMEELVTCDSKDKV